MTTLDSAEATRPMALTGQESAQLAVPELQDVKYQVAVANRILVELGLASGILISLGHASMRLPSQPDKFVVKGRGYAIDALSRMRPEDMVVCDLDGYKVEGPPGATQCFEVQMHACIYAARPDVHSVVHAHPRYTVMMSVLGATLVPMCQEGIRLVRQPLPVYPHVKTIQSVEEGKGVATVLQDRPAVLLRGHGATTTGSSLSEAVLNMAQLEEQAKMNWYAHVAAGPDHPRIEDGLIDEMDYRPALGELPHFRDVLGPAGRVRTDGVWKHYADLVSRDFS